MFMSVGFGAQCFWAGVGVSGVGVVVCGLGGCGVG